MYINFKKKVSKASNRAIIGHGTLITAGGLDFSLNKMQERLFNDCFEPCLRKLLAGELLFLVDAP